LIWIRIFSFFILLISCNGSDTKTDCIAYKDYYNPRITHFECPDGTTYSSTMAAGIEDGDIVDLETEVSIVEVK
jgi:hypothetical protein